MILVAVNTSIFLFFSRTSQVIVVVRDIFVVPPVMHNQNSIIINANMLSLMPSRQSPIVASMPDHGIG